MRYLITTNTQQPMFTDWFDAENHFNESVAMVVYDLYEELYTIDGVTWNTIERDHL